MGVIPHIKQVVIVATITGVWISLSPTSKKKFFPCMATRTLKRPSLVGRPLNFEKRQGEQRNH